MNISTKSEKEPKSAYQVGLNPKPGSSEPSCHGLNCCLILNILKILRLDFRSKPPQVHRETHIWILTCSRPRLGQVQVQSEGVVVKDPRTESKVNRA